MGAAVTPRSAFGPLAALFHDALAPCASDAEVAWLAERLRQEEGPTLDAMCGTGRVLLPLARRGVNVHGVDRSPAMLERCEAKLAASGTAAPVFRQDVAELNLPLRYGAAFIAGDAFGLLTDPAAAAATLARLRAHLVAPGVLVLECEVPSESKQRLAAPLVEVRTVKLADGSQIVERSETVWTPEARLSHAQRRYTHRLGTAALAEEHETLTRAWYAQGDLVELVRAAGFREVASEPAAIAADDGGAFAVTARL